MKPLSLTKPGKTGHHTGSGGLAAEFTSTRDAFDELEKRQKELEKRQKELEQLWASLTGYHEMVQRLTALEAKKRTCGECIEAYWRGDMGICLPTGGDKYAASYCTTKRDNEACDNFKREATRKTCGGTAERGM